MSYAPTTPVTGASVAGFTSPTYTLTSDTAPNANSKQHAITALGGTQANVETHSVSKPFTVTMFRPAVLRSVPQQNAVTGILKNVPVNTYKLLTRKGAQPAANQVSLVPRVYTVFEIPAGCDTYEPEDIKALVSLHIGVLSQQSSGIADTLLTGVL